LPPPQQLLLWPPSRRSLLRCLWRRCLRRRPGACPRSAAPPALLPTLLPLLPLLLLRLRSRACPPPPRRCLRCCREAARYSPRRRTRRRPRAEGARATAAAAPAATAAAATATLPSSGRSTSSPLRFLSRAFLLLLRLPRRSLRAARGARARRLLARRCERRCWCFCSVFLLFPVPCIDSFPFCFFSLAPHRPPPFSWIAFLFAFRFFEVIGTDVFLLLRFFTFREERKRRKRGFVCKRKKREENVFHSLSVFFFLPSSLSFFSIAFIYSCVSLPLRRTAPAAAAAMTRTTARTSE